MNDSRSVEENVIDPVFDDTVSAWTRVSVDRGPQSIVAIGIRWNRCLVG